jgi:hypothetical protein
MGCACKPTLVLFDPGARAAMCDTCPRVARAKGVDGIARGVRCTVHGGDVASLVMRQIATCPRGRWPDEAGVVRWLGVRWLGVPMPLRHRLEQRYGRAVRLSACGCVAGLKRFWIEEAEGMGRWDIAGMVRAIAKAISTRR